MDCRLSTVDFLYFSNNILLSLHERPPETREIPEIPVPPEFICYKKNREILSVNPTVISQRVDAEVVTVSVYDYTPELLEEKKSDKVESVFHYKNTPSISWINIDGIRKSDVEAACTNYGIHP